MYENLLNHDPESEDPDAEQPTYEGIQLKCGWKVIGTENLATSNGKNLWGNRGSWKGKLLDIEETFQLLCGERLLNDHVRVREGDLEVFGAASFELFFLSHIKAKDDELFDERLSRNVLRQWKSAIRHLVWEKAMKNLLLSCLKPVNDNGITTAVTTDPEAKLEKMETVAQEDCKLNLHPLFALKFTSDAPFQCFVDESKVASLLYTNEILYNKAGSVAMTAFDIATSIGGSEAIVESFYSVMDTQRQVRQLHTTLENRTILDWATSNVLNLEDVISKAAKLYVDGSSSLKLPRHRVGVMKKKTEKSYKASQVLTRMKLEKGRYSFLS
ncbi:Hypothetical predicted protein [Paramuricea clavata]|uniref:Uncharacterized protein n=1 Tax=Paramuricea clavata TaxID=317549 RepID=A0A6S7HBL3_PARCT|nr:Hypothetical predicted protein [Paramuricea clavata]